MFMNLVTVAIALLVAILIIRFLFPDHLARMLIATMRTLLGLKLRSVDVNGISWPYLEGGDPAGEAVILVHGFGGDKYNWPTYAWHLRKGHRVIAPDLPGFGENDKDPRADYSSSAQADRLAEFATALGIEQFHIAGNSMGGYIALLFALRYPDRLRTMTLLNNAGVSSINESKVEEAADRGENLLVVNSIEEFEKLLELVAEKRIPFPRVVLNYIGKQAVEQRDFIDPIFWKLYEDITQSPLDDELSKIRVPTLTIWGRHDRVLDVSCTEVMMERIPDHECIVLEGVGHLPMIESPAEVAAAQRKLIARQSAA